MNQNHTLNNKMREAFALKDDRVDAMTHALEGARLGTKRKLT